MRLMPVIVLDKVVLPGEEITLHVDEPRSRQLFADSQSEASKFVLARLSEGLPNDYGVSARVVEIIRRYTTGELDVSIRGVEIVKINRFYERHPLKLYSAGSVTVIATNIYSASNSLINEFKKFAYRYLPKERLLDTIRGDIFELAVMLGLTDEQKNSLLTMFNAAEMERFITNIMRTRAALLNQEAQLHGNYYLN